MREVLKANKKLFLYISGGGVVLYIFLCGLHFASARPLWGDEIAILNNLRELQPHQIFGPLKYTQAFPRLYLFIIQKISAIFEYNVFSLRVLPLLFMFAGFFMWLSLYRTEEGRDTDIGYLLFIFSWCGSYFMTYYSAELKQYSMDLFVGAIFTLILLKQKTHLKNNIRPSLISVYMFAPALVLFSYTGYFFALLPAYNLLLGRRYNRKNLVYLCVYSLFTLVFIYISYNYDVKYIRPEPGFWDYWKDYFISTTSFYEFMKSFTEGLRNIFVRWLLETKLVKHIMTIFFPFALYAVISSGLKQIREDKGLIVSIKSLALFLISALFIAGILKLYPFTGARITLFICPFIFYAIIRSIKIFEKIFFPVSIVLLTIYILTIFSTSAYLLYKYLFLTLPT